MTKAFKIIYKSVRRICNQLSGWIDKVGTLFILCGNGVAFHDIHTKGVPYVMVAMGGKMRIGRNFNINNGIKGNPIGCNERCTFFVDRGASIEIGDNVGMSQSALVSMSSIRIGNNVKIGGGTMIFTTDFHSIDPIIRASKDDSKHRKVAPVVIGDNAFIGARCIILKGVTIGKNSVIGAGSVVTKSVPDNQIWAGNPARYIKDVATEREN